MRRIGSPAFAVALLGAATGPAAAQDLEPFVQVGPSVLVYRGKDGDRANAGIIRTPVGYVLVDTGHTPADSERIRRALLRSRLDVRYLIVTQPHPDHHVGAFVFSPPALLVAHEATRAAMARMDPRALATLFATRYPEAAESLRGYRMVLPDLTFTDVLTLHLGGVEVRLTHLPDAHTQGDAAVWLPQEGVLFGGGAVNIRRHLNLADGSSAGILRALDRLAALQPAVVVPAHGAIGGPADLAVLRQYVLDLRAEVQRRRAAGQDLEGVLAQARLPQYDEWPGKEWLRGTFTRVYRELAGE
ncbi:MAG TPA: MBL fold metallo-hydrolase [Candidatus Methylomirabilis sp.]|nr:MBL fold metallo-hydrolase [Candidatus Methylomirabilis sp.]